MHYLVNTQAELEVTFDAGAATGAVSVVVKDAAGVQVATGDATQDPDNDARYTYKLTPQADVKTLTTTWTGTWDAVEQSIATSDEIVGSVLFTLTELRNFDAGALASAGSYPDSMLRLYQAQLADDFEQICNVSFVRRYSRDILDGNWRRYVYLMNRRPQKILAVTVDGDVYTSDDIGELELFDSGKVYKPGPWPWNPVTPRNVTFEYEYGWPQPPAMIKRAALVLARYELVTRDIGDRVVSINTELGAVRLSVPGTNYPTGIPVVDAALGRYDATSQIEAF